MGRVDRCGGVRAYAETNFLLEIAHRQSGAADCLNFVRLARAGVVELLIPAVCFGEAAEHFVGRYRSRAGLKEALEDAAAEAGRSSDRGAAGLKAEAAVLASRFVGLVDREERRFRRLRDRLVAAGCVLPVDGLSVKEAANTELPVQESGRKGTGFGRWDAVILGSVLADAAERPVENLYFVTTDKTLRQHDVAKRACANRNVELRASFSDLLNVVRP